MVRIRYADQKLLCLQWKCGLGLEMALSVDARRGSAPCRWAFPCVLFIIKKCWNEILVILKKNNINHQNHSNNAKKQKNFQMTKHLHRDLSTTNQKLLCLQWKCGLGLKIALSVDARRGSAPCRWAFPGVLFIIKKMLERNFW